MGEGGNGDTAKGAARRRDAKDVAGPYAGRITRELKIARPITKIDFTFFVQSRMSFYRRVVREPQSRIQQDSSEGEVRA